MVVVKLIRGLLGGLITLTGGPATCLTPPPIRTWPPWWSMAYTFPLFGKTPVPLGGDINGLIMFSSAMAAGSKSLFLFLMGLAWRCRYSMPLLLSSTAAVLGHAWMFQIRVHTVQRMHENELVYFDEEEEGEDSEQDSDSGTWETESRDSDSWETIHEEVAYG